MKKCLLIIGLVMGTWAMADDYLIEILPDKKVLHVDRLGISDNTSVMDVLEIMPEVISRGGEFYINNFSIQVDDQDVGESRDVVLEQTRIVEVEAIEISTSPTVSEQKNGQGGVINILLKKVEEGTAGHVMADVGTNFTNSVDFMPSVYISHRTNNFYLRASLAMEYYRPKLHRTTTTLTDTSALYQYNTTFESYKQETAKLLLGYNNGQDKVEFWVWESMLSGPSTTTSSMKDEYKLEQQTFQSYTNQVLLHERTSNNHPDGLQAVAHMVYNHLYRIGGEFNIEANYLFTKSLQFTETTDDLWSMCSREDGNSLLGHDVTMEVKSKNFLLPSTSQHKLELEYGLNGAYSKGRQSPYEHIYVNGTKDNNLSYDVNTQTQYIYASPFVQLDWIYRSLYLRVGARYQYYKRDLSLDTQGYSQNTSHEVTANINLGWQVQPHHHLRFIVARNIIRPTDLQVYPYCLYYPYENKHVMGNDSLDAPSYHNVALDYIFNYDHDAHHVIFNTELEYINANGLIRDITKYHEGLGIDDYYYTTYINSGTAHVVRWNTAVYYQYKILSLAFTSNIYANLRETDGIKDRYTFFNIALEPIFSFPKDWTFGGKFLYNSRIKRIDSYLGDCFYAQLKLSKTWGKWNVHIQLNDVFGYQSVDRTLIEEGYIESTYNLYQRTFMAGFCYKF